MRLSFLVPPMATLFMAAPALANVSAGFTLAPVPANDRLFPGTVELLRNKSVSSHKVLVSVSLSKGAVTLLHNGNPVGCVRQDGCRNTLLTIGRDDTIALAMDLAQGAASGTYTIEVV